MWLHWLYLQKWLCKTSAPQIPSTGPGPGGSWLPHCSGCCRKTATWCVCLRHVWELSSQVNVWDCGWWQTVSLAVWPLVSGLIVCSLWHHRMSGGGNCSNFSNLTCKKSFYPLLIMSSDQVIVGCSITFIYICHTSVVVLYNFWLCNFTMLNTEFTSCWWITHVCHYVYMCLSLCTIGSSHVLDWISVQFSNFFNGSRSFGITFLSGLTVLQQFIFFVKSSDMSDKEKVVHMQLMPMIFLSPPPKKKFYISMCCCHICSCTCPILP
jgi:hypothetical protein